MKRAIAGFLLLAFPALAAAGTAGPEPEPVAPELQAFIVPGTKLLDVARADLNGDGREDVILVLEKQSPQGADASGDLPQGQRPLLILIRQPDNTLKLVKRNGKIVYCSTCGGGMGDPYQPLVAGPKTFTVPAYGGSAWRWATEFQFDYSRKDDTWQLVRVTESSFNATAPDEGKTEVFTPPQHYGKIDIADFDPENWKGQGKK